MRRVLSILLILILIFGIFPITASAQSQISVYLDGRKLQFDVPPSVIKGRTLVPLRKIFEELGAEIEWNSETRTITATKGNTVVELTIGKDTAYKNRNPIKLDVPGTIINNRTLVPLRFVAEALNCTVGWEGNTRTVIIDSTVKKKVKVTDVTDGDTFTVDWDGKEEKIRLIGVDTPETVHPTIGEEPYGKQASNYTKQKLMGQTVLIALDVEERDKYGRILGYVFLENGSFYNADLVVNGYAQVATFPPNVKWVDLFTYLQTYSRENEKGLWDETDNSFDQAPTKGNGQTGKVTIVSVDLDKEIVVIKNTDTKDINLSGWKLVSVEGNQQFHFPDGFVLKAGATVQIVSGKDAAEGNGKLLWSKSYIWNNEKDKAELYDANGKLVSSFE